MVKFEPQKEPVGLGLISRINIEGHAQTNSKSFIGSSLNESQRQSVVTCIGGSKQFNYSSFSSPLKMVDFEKPYTIEHFQKDRQTCMTFQTKEETNFDALK
jgi:hypothetical protein